MADNWNQLVVVASGRAGSPDFGWDPFSGVRKIGKAIGGAISSAGSKIKKVPVVGAGLHAVYSTAASPITLTADIAAGHNVGKSVVKNFKTQLHAVKDIAPYVQTVVSFVPGIGTAAAGVIGAATELARGRPIDEALIAGVSGALPGGAVTQSAFKMTYNAIKHGKTPTKEDLSAFNLSDEQKQAIVTGTAAVKDIAKGKRVDEVAFKRSIEMLPPDYQKAVTTGLALGQAEKIQHEMKKEAKDAPKKLYDIAKSKIGRDPIVSAGVSTLTGETKKGFLVGQGMVGFRFSPTELNAVRGNLPVDQKKGFDIAMSAHIGKMTAPPVKRNISAKAKFGYYASLGMRGAKPKNQEAMKQVLIADSDTARGVAGAKATIEKEKNLKYMSFWARVRYALFGK